MYQKGRMIQTIRPTKVSGFTQMEYLQYYSLSALFILLSRLERLDHGGMDQVGSPMFYILCIIRFVFIYSSQIEVTNFNVKL